MARIQVEILGDASSLERAYKKAAADTDKFGRGVSKTGKDSGGVFGGITKGVVGLAGGLVGVGGLSEAVKASFDRMKEGQKTAAQTVAVLKSTHDASNVTAEGVDNLAQSLFKKTGIDNETIKSGENLLLTFTNIRNETGKGNDIFNQATGTILNMSTALGEDTKSAAIQLGKALQDPVKGVTALHRVGVNFTDAQKEQIKQMVKSGNTMGAQKVILKELNTEFGNSATAAGKTLPGKLAILKTTFANLGASVATQLAPQIQNVVGKMVDWLSKTQNQKKIIDGFKTAVGYLKDAINFLKGAFHLLSGAVGGNKNALKVLAGAFVAFKVASIVGKIASIVSTIGGIAGAVTKAVPFLIGKGGLAGTAATTGEELAGAGGLTASIEGVAAALGPLVLGAGVLAAGYFLGKLLMDIKPVQDAFFSLGDTIAGALGIGAAAVHQIKVPSQATATAARHQAGALEAAGMSRPQATQAITRQFNLDPAAAKILSGEAAGKNAPVYHIHGPINVQANDPKALSEALQRQARQKPRVR